MEGASDGATDGRVLGVHVRPLPLLQLRGSMRLGSTNTLAGGMGLNVGKSVELLVLVTVVYSGQIVICNRRSDDRCGRVAFLVRRSWSGVAVTVYNDMKVVMTDAADMIVIGTRTWHLILL